MRLKVWLGLIIALIFFIVATLTLSDYGLNEDSPFHFLRGQAYLRLLTTGKNSFDQPQLPSPVLFIPGQKISSYKLNAWEANLAPVRPILSSEEDPTIQQIFDKYQQKFGRQSFYKHNAWSAEYFKNNEGPGHPPVSDILSALTNQLLYEKLGVLGDIESYHLYAVITASLLLFFIYLFTLRVWGVLPATMATLSLALYPIFFAESHFNIKDIPQLSFFSLGLISLFFWIVDRKLAWFTIFTVSTFLALGTKLNIIFLPLIVLPWFFLIRKSQFFKNWFSGKLVIFALVFFIFNSALFILTWPYLWDNPLQKVVGILNFYQEVGSVDPTIQQPSAFLTPLGVDLKALILVFTSTPPLAIIFLAVGLLVLARAAFKKSPDSEDKDITRMASILVLLWFLIPILRVLRPGADIFGSIRQYIEFLPALCVAVGVGSGFLIEKIRSILRWPQKFQLAPVLGYLLYLGWISISLHPNQNLYFNLQATSLLSWQTSYDNPYRQAVNWLNEHAQRGAKLAYLDGTMTAISPIWLRDDILLGSYFSAFSQKGEYIVSIVYPNPPKVFPYLYLERFLEPVYQVQVGETVAAKVWINDQNHVKNEYRKMTELKNNFQLKTGQDNLGQYWEVQLDRPYLINKLAVKPSKENCQARDGVFYLEDYLVAQRVDLGDITEFYFPAEPSDKIRFWSINPQSCFRQVEIQSVTVLENQ